MKELKGIEIIVVGGHIGHVETLLHKLTEINANLIFIDASKNDVTPTTYSTIEQNPIPIIPREVPLTQIKPITKHDRREQCKKGWRIKKSKHQWQK